MCRCRAFRSPLQTTASSTYTMARRSCGCVQRPSVHSFRAGCFMQFMPHSSRTCMLVQAAFEMGLGRDSCGDCTGRTGGPGWRRCTRQRRLGRTRTLSCRTCWAHPLPTPSGEGITHPDRAMQQNISLSCLCHSCPIGSMQNRRVFGQICCSSPCKMFPQSSIEEQCSATEDGAPSKKPSD